MFKISSTDKNGAPNDFSQILVDPIVLIYHIIEDQVKGTYPDLDKLYIEQRYNQ